MSTDTAALREQIAVYPPHGHRYHHACRACTESHEVVLELCDEIDRLRALAPVCSTCAGTGEVTYPEWEGDVRVCDGGCNGTGRVGLERLITIGTTVLQAAHDGDTFARRYIPGGRE